MQELSSANVRLCDYCFENSVENNVNHSLNLTKSKRITNTLKTIWMYFVSFFFRNTQLSK